MIENKHLHILLVEDEVLIAMMESRQLEDRGYTVHHAIDGETAIALMKDTQNDFDLILMDIDLGSELDGTEAAEIILHHHHIPIIFLSGHTEREIVERTEKITSYGYVVKNSGIIVLDASIKMALRLFNAHLAIREREERFRHAFEYSAAGVCMVDLQGHFTQVNSVMTKMFGYSEEEFLNRNFTDITYAEDTSIGTDRFDQMLAGHMTHTTFEKRYVKKDGGILWGVVSASLIRDHHHAPQFFITHITDITAMKQAALVITKREEELQLALEVARLGYWRYDCVTHEVKWHHQHEKLFGIPLEDFGGTLDAVQHCVHPDDRAQGIDNLQTTLTHHVPFDNTYRVIHPDGTVLWLHSYGYLYDDEAGHPAYIFGITQDITDRKVHAQSVAP